MASFAAHDVTGTTSDTGAASAAKASAPKLDSVQVDGGLVFVRGRESTCSLTGQFDDKSEKPVMGRSG